MFDVTILWLRPPKGKVSVRRERIAEHLRTRGFEITLRDMTPRSLITTVRDVLSGKYDLVIGNVRAGLYVGYPLALISRTPFIGDVSDPITDIDTLPFPLYRLLERYEFWILNCVEEAIYVPEVYRDASERGLDGRSAPNSVDFDRFSDPDQSIVDESRDILVDSGVNMDSPIVIYIGAITENRYIDQIVDAAKRTSNWQFVIIGEGPLESVVDSASNTVPNLFRLGPFDYELIPGFLSHANAALCLVTVERPLKISEYGAASLPTIGNPGKLQREFSDEEVFFTQPTPDGIAEALSQIEANPNEAARRAANLRDDAREHSWNAVADVYEAAIRNRLSESFVKRE
ncbi:glycosyltransferase [Natrialbaceae archaeon GCM10025810]|uniref:glycosyltransferase n=1 Tax=Halovalidus salilacus TaxID=3075124 RepID=UPI0036180ACC